MLIIHSPLLWRLRVDRLKRSVDQCGRKSFYAFTKRKRIRVDGALDHDRKDEAMFAFQMTVFQINVTKQTV